MKHPVIQAAQEAAQGGYLLGAMTVIFFAFFIGYAIWAWWPTNRRYMEQMAAAPLDDDVPGDKDGNGRSYLLSTGGPR